LGAPAVPFAAAFPSGWRRTAHAAGRTPPLAVLRRATTHPVVTWLLALIALWIWHAPPLYELALRNQPIHVLEHVSFFGTALLYWWVALQPSGPRRLPRGFDVLYVFAGSFQGAALGFLLTFAAVPLYPFYGATVGTWGLTPLQDQQLAGIIMWLPSGLIYLVIAGGLFLRWMHATERSSRRLEGAAQVRASSPFPPSSPSEAWLG
jgi:cytochrome c oxidase assembly factor CtaG